jgi:hypothetical protein
LFFVGLGAMGLLAQFLAAFADTADWRPPARPWRGLAWSVVVLLVVVNVALAAVLTPLVALVPPVFNEPVRAAMLSLPHGPETADQDLIIVNSPDHLIYVTTVAAMRMDEGHPSPRAFRALAPQPVAMSIERLDERTLRIEFERGLYRTILGWLFRGPDRPLRAGEAVALGDMRIEVAEVGEAGNPMAVVYRFNEPLEHESYNWVKWEDGVYVPFEPPAIGEVVDLPATRSPLELQPDEIIDNYRRARAWIESR